MCHECDIQSITAHRDLRVLDVTGLKRLTDKALVDVHERLPHLKVRDMVIKWLSAYSCRS